MEQIPSTEGPVPGREGQNPTSTFLLFLRLFEDSEETVELFNLTSRFVLECIYFSSVVHLNSTIPSVFICKMDLILFL